MSPQTYGGLPDGAYQFSVRAQGETIATSQSFVKDTQPPAVGIDAGASFPAAASSSPAATASVAFYGQDAGPVGFACVLSASGGSGAQGSVYRGTVNPKALPLGKPFNCSSPEVLHWLLPGRWALAVTGTDGAGNAAAPVEHAWTVAFQPGQQYTRFSRCVPLLHTDPRA